MPSNPYRKRQRSLSLILKRKRLPALLVTHPQNILYLTGSKVSAGALLVTPRSSLFFLDGRYLETGSALRWQETRALSTLAEVLRSWRQLGFEADHVSVTRASAWKEKYKSTIFIQTSGLVEGLRAMKDADEQLSIKCAISITKKILKKIPPLLCRGVPEKDIARKIEQLAHELGAEEMAFDTIVGFGENTSRPHHHPTDRKFQSGDMVQIDLGVKVDGYCSDMSRVFFTGKQSPEQSKAYRALQQAKKLAEKSVRVGVTNHELDRIARDELKRHGYDKEFCHSLGHGLGLDIHEAPTISMKAPKHRLKKNEVITIEPGLYFAGKWGMRIEDTIVVG